MGGVRGRGTQRMTHAQSCWRRSVAVGLFCESEIWHPNVCADPQTTQAYPAWNLYGVPLEELVTEFTVCVRVRVLDVN